MNKLREQTSGKINDWTDGRTDRRQTDGRTNEGTKERTTEQTNKRTDGVGRKNRSTDERTNVRTDEWMNIIVLLFIQNNYSLKQGKNELLANRTSKNADVSRWLIKAVFTRIFWLFVCSVFQRYLSHLNSSFKLLLCGRKKKTVKALCDGEFYSQLSTTTELHNIRISQLGIKEWKIQAHFTDLITRVNIPLRITVWKITFMSRRWTSELRVGEIAPHEEGKRPELPILHVRQTKRREISPLHSFRRPVNVSALHHFNVKPFP